MTAIEAVILGIVQGLFMFIPVSSTSHLALTQHWMNATGSTMPAPDSPEMILFDIVVHVGTLVSIVIVMWAGLRRLTIGIGADMNQFLVARRSSDRRVRTRRVGIADDAHGRTTVAAYPFLRLAGLGMITVAVTGLLGLGVRAFGTEVFATPALIAGALVITGAILWWTDTAGPQWRGPRDLTVWVAVWIGVAQAAALLPGLSRSGLTIAMALLLGMYRPIAAQYSFFVAIPTILAAMAVQAASVLGDGTAVLTIDLTAYVLGFVVAAIVGAISLALVLKLLYQARFRYFSIYVWILAIVVLAVQPAGH